MKKPDPTRGASDLEQGKVERGGVDLHRRPDARQPPRDQPPDEAGAVEHRQRLARVMPEPGIRFLTFVRQRYPGLDAVHRTAVGPQLLEALGMGDTQARGHPVDLAGPDRLRRADAAAIPDLAIEQVSDTRKADIRMRTDRGLRRPDPLHHLCPPPV